MRVLESRYGGFMSNAAASVQLEVDILDKAPGDPHADLEVQHEGKQWQLTRADLRAEWDGSTGRGKVWQTANPHSIDVVLRILHTLLLAEKDGFLLHAASAVLGDRAFVFSGVSGAGKTTLSRLAPSSATVLTDEISLLKLEDGVFRAWGTPFSGEMATPGPNRSAKLARVFLLKKGPENVVEPMNPDEAVCAILRNVLFFADDGDLGGRILETTCRLVEKVPVKRLIFRPDASVWDFIALLGVDCE